ncbi:MAG: DNA-formamidopyrimidine glycosylase family protein [Acidimicrobiia bacterium]
MPELPDVQVFKELVDATSLHRRVENLMLRQELVEETDPQTIRDHLRGSHLTETRRHGKHLFVHIDDNGWLRLHFGMTGDLVSYSKGDEPKYTQLRIDFDDGSHLAYSSKRKFGTISWVGDVEQFIEDHELGPDATNDLDLDRFGRVLAQRRGSIKGTLMNQEALAGLGNVYVDAILFQAGIRPRSDTATG